MPKFTKSYTDRAYESFDAVDVHFACRLNEIGSPVSTGTRRRLRLSRGIWIRKPGKQRKEVGKMIFRNDNHGVTFEKEIKYHKGLQGSKSQIYSRKFAAALLEHKDGVRCF